MWRLLESQGVIHRISYSSRTRGKRDLKQRFAYSIKHEHRFDNTPFEVHKYKRSRLVAGHCELKLISSFRRAQQQKPTAEASWSDGTCVTLFIPATMDVSTLGRAITTPCCAWQRSHKFWFKCVNFAGDKALSCTQAGFSMLWYRRGNPRLELFLLVGPWTSIYRLHIYLEN